MKLALHGAYFSTNFGDILLHRILVKWIREIDDSIHITLPLCPVSNLKTIGADSAGTGDGLDVDGLIFAGGGYFGEPARDVEAWTLRNFDRYLKIGLRAVDKRLPTAIIGVGVGPISNGRFREAVVKIFNHSACATVRDVESMEYLLEYGVDQDRIRVTADSALTLASLREDPQFVQDVEKRKGRLLRRQGQGLLGVHVQGEPLAVTSAELYKALNEWQRANPNWRALKMRDRELPLIRWLLRRCLDAYTDFRKGQKEPPVIRHSSFDDLIKMIAAFDVIITNKLHVGIVGCALGVKVLSFPAHPKTSRFYRQVGLGDACVEELSTENFQLGSLLERLELLEGGQLPSAIRKSQENRDALKDFILSLRSPRSGVNQLKSR